MLTNHKLLALAALLLFVSLACSQGADSPPAAPPETAETVTPPPVSQPTTPPTIPPVSGPEPPADLEMATVAEVVDGDTIELADGRRVRYIGINTPERNQPYYADASQTNEQLVAGREVGLDFDQDTFDQYGRTLAYVWVDGVMANLEIVRRGFANTYTVPPNVKYEDEFLAAERDAREAERGLWAGADVALKITNLEANAPGNDNENPNGEWIEITNQGDTPVTMTGYTLKDAANHIYTFGDLLLPPGDAIRLYSGTGQSSLTELYWGYSGESVWNNGGDTAFLRDTEGRLVDMYAY